MKLLLVIVLSLSTATVLNNGAVLSFIDKSYTFPDTKEGVVLKHDFEFENTGDQPLLIADYRVACTCTKVDFPKKAIMLGEKGIIRVQFDTNDKFGFQNRIVEIYYNGNRKPVKIRFKVTVIPKA